MRLVDSAKFSKVIFFRIERMRRIRTDRDESVAGIDWHNLKQGVLFFIRSNPSNPLHPCSFFIICVGTRKSPSVFGLHAWTFSPSPSASCHPLIMNIRFPR